MLRQIEIGIAGRALDQNYLEKINKHAQESLVVEKVFTRQDGSIRVIAEGEEVNLLEFSERLDSGRLFATVENFYLRWHLPSEMLHNPALKN